MYQQFVTKPMPMKVGGYGSTVEIKACCKKRKYNVGRVYS